MADLLSLSEKTAGEIDAPARKISVAHRLDAEIQAELRGHVKDKVRGYVSGEVKVTEADALLLATSHFGEAGVIKGMFQRVHGAAHAVSLGRRLAAALAASIGVAIATEIAQILWGYLVMYPVATMNEALQAPFPQALSIAFLILPTVLEIFFLWKIFAFWRKRQAQGRRIWFEAYRPSAILGMVVMLYLTLLAIEWSGGQLWQLFDLGRILMHVYGLPFGAYTGAMISVGLRLASVFVGVLLWLWWADRTPRTMKTLLFTTASSLAAGLMMSVVNTLPFLLSLARRGSLSAQPDIIPKLLLSMTMMTGLNVVVGGLALVLYRTVNRPRGIRVRD